MKRLPKQGRVFLICLAIALVLHEIAGYFLFDTDLLEAAGRKSQAPLMAVTFLVFARAFLYFVAPPWGLFLVVRTVVESQMRRNPRVAPGQATEPRDNVDP